MQHSNQDREEVGVVNAHLLPDVKPDRRIYSIVHGLHTRSYMYIYMYTHIIIYTCIYTCIYTHIYIYALW